MYRMLYLPICILLLYVRLMQIKYCHQFMLILVYTEYILVVVKDLVYYNIKKWVTNFYPSHNFIHKQSFNFITKLKLSSKLYS